jgi:hypothetical protein
MKKVIVAAFAVCYSVAMIAQTPAPATTPKADMKTEVKKDAKAVKSDAKEMKHDVKANDKAAVKTTAKETHKDAKAMHHDVKAATQGDKK